MKIINLSYVKIKYIIIAKVYCFAQLSKEVCDEWTDAL